MDTDMMWSDKRINRLIEKHGTFTFVKSSGPGGQNVNKRNTSVHLTMAPKQHYEFWMDVKRIMDEETHHGK